MDKYLFQYCQKIVVFDKNNSRVLLAKRVGENDFDRTFSFIGGKIETTDPNPIEGMRREKNEEVGADFKISLYPLFSTANYFIKKDGNCMILPHYYAKYLSGEINLNQEYSEYKWVEVDKLETFEPKIDNIPDYARRLLALMRMMDEKDFVVI